LGTKRPEPVVLVVEDEALIRMIVVDYLEDLGFKVEEAGSAASAMDKMRASNCGIDAAIVDIGLPDKRGDVLAAELRALDPKLPLIIASGYGEGSSKGSFPEGVAFLGKPYEMKKLEEALASCGLVRPDGRKQPT
jgi:DNA-binding response OmpR family regulator